LFRGVIGGGGVGGPSPPPKKKKKRKIKSKMRKKGKIGRKKEGNYDTSNYYIYEVLVLSNFSIVRWH